MQKTLRILATLPSPIGSSSANFKLPYPKYGNGTVVLTVFGDYSLSVYGATEGSARRTNEYKAAYNKVTMDMLHKYEAENRRYTSIHRDMPKVKDVGSYQQELTALTPQTYKRATFTLEKPTKANIEDDLRNEVKSLNFDKTKPEVVSEKDFIRQNLNALTEIRQQGWQEAFELFTQIEDAREKRENAKFFAEYKAKYNKQKDYIEGKESIVLSELSLMTNNVKLSYNVELSCDYNQNLHLLNVVVVFEDGINVPINKAVVLASGKISIKNKLVKETITDKTNSTLSCVYYLASNLFNVSPNIQYLRMSVYDRTKSNPLMWVEFERGVFSRINPKMVGLHSDILGYPHVIDFKTKGEALELAAMNPAAFDREVKAEIDRVNSNRPQTVPSVMNLEDGNIAVSYEDAQRLAAIPNLSATVRKAISTAKDNGWDYVALEGKYKSILDELNNTK